MKNYQVVRPINAYCGPYDFELIRSGFRTIGAATKWGDRNMNGLPYDVRNDGEPLTEEELNELAYGKEKESIAIIRLPPTTMGRKRRYLRAAKGKALADWIYETCDREAEKEDCQSARE